MIAQLPQGFTTRPATLDDLDSVFDLLAACSMAEHGGLDFTREQIAAHWRQPGFDLATDTVMVFGPEGELAAEADVERRGAARLWSWVSVHPSFRGRDIGSHLAAWVAVRHAEWAAEAPPDARVTSRQEVAAVNRGARELLEQNGYRPVRRSWQMEIELEELPSVPEWPEGVSVRGLVRGQDEYPLYEAMEEAFAEHWGHVDPLPFERYAARHFEREGFDPSLYLLAVDGSTIAGAVLCQIRPDMGWIGGLGVRKPWRRRGLGEALLLRGFAELYGRGLRQVGLGVDAENTTGATRLYERVGMHMTREWIEYEQEIAAAREADVR